jgi:hypothetical protein
MRLFRKRGMKAWIWQGAAVLAASLLGATASAQVYRCGNAYSSAPCAGGKAIDTTPPLSARGDLAGKTTIYLCQSYGGGQFWTREHCAQRDALVERMETVPSGMPFEQQVEMAQNQRNSAQARSVPPPPSFQPPQAYAAQPGLQAQCQALDQRVERLDAQARAGGRPHYMDRIAHERKEARDLQFRLRCN